MVTKHDGVTVAQALNEQLKVKSGRGRRPAFSPETENDLLRRYLATTASMRDLALEMRVGTATIMRALKRARDRLSGQSVTAFIEGGAK